MVRLEDVYPNNQSYLVLDGAVKTRFREGFDHEIFMTTGEIYELSIDVGNIAMTFAEGHKIRVAVSSALFPRYDKNPNTGEPFKKHTNTKIAHNIIYTDSAHASCIILPTLQGTTKVVKMKDNFITNNFVLHQNYPNPFNLSTSINYQLTAVTHVKLIIYDIIGRKVRTLIDLKKTAGEHSVSWDGTDDFGNLVSSGMYFYQLKSDNNNSMMNKMLLIK